jgi:uncharacterized SAM-binding protein YcdF (DUF218 family)
MRGRPLEEEPEPEAPPPRRRRLWRLALLPLLAVLGWGLFLDLYGQADQAAPAQAIIVLGSRVLPNGEPGDSLRARTAQAVRLYHRGFAPALITTGGLDVENHAPPTEAAAAARLAKRLGVPDAAIIEEPASTSTRENARNAARICRAHGWTRVIIVSDPYHLWRAHRNFTLEGLTAYPSPARDCARNRQPQQRVLWTLREMAAILRDVVQRK